MDFDATFLVATISFVVFVFIMNAIFYAPILKIMRERQMLVENNYKNAKSINEESDKKLAYRNEELDKAGEEARKKIADLNKQLKIEKSTVISEFKEGLSGRIADTKNDLRQSAYDAKEVLKDKVVDIAGDISEILFGSDLAKNGITKEKIDETIE